MRNDIAFFFNHFFGVATVILAGIFALYFFLITPWYYIVGGIVIAIAAWLFVPYIVLRFWEKKWDKEREQAKLAEQEKNKVRYVIIK